MLKQARELGIKARVRVRRRRVHRRDEQARRRRGRRPDLLAGGHPARGRQQGVPRRVQRRSTARSSSTRRSSTTRTNVADRGDAEGRLDRSGQVPAGAAQDQLQRRHRQDRVRRQGRPQGRRDDDLHDEGRQGRADRHHQGRQVAIAVRRHGSGCRTAAGTRRSSGARRAPKNDAPASRREAAIARCGVARWTAPFVAPLLCAAGTSAVARPAARPSRPWTSSCSSSSTASRSAASTPSSRSATRWCTASSSSSTSRTARW